MPQPPETEFRRNNASHTWSYASLMARQNEWKSRILNDPSTPGVILVSEVSPVVTLGRRAKREEELRATPWEFEARGIELLETSRGGLATYHGPGQWVVFVVDRLERLTGDSRGVRRAVEGLLNLTLTVAREYDPAAELRDGIATGVWGRQGKIASVGVQIEDGVLLHGLCVNAFRTAESFFGLRPCGMDGAKLQYLLDETAPGAPREAAFVTLGERLVEAVKTEFYPS